MAKVFHHDMANILYLKIGCLDSNRPLNWIHPSFGPPFSKPGCIENIKFLFTPLDLTHKVNQNIIQIEN